MPNVRIEILDIKGIKDSFFLLKKMILDRKTRTHARLGFTVSAVTSDEALLPSLFLNDIYKAFEKQGLRVLGLEIFGENNAKEMIGVVYVPMLIADTPILGGSLQEYLGLNQTEMDSIILAANKDILTDPIQVCDMST